MIVGVAVLESDVKRDAMWHVQHPTWTVCASVGHTVSMSLSALVVCQYTQCSGRTSVHLSASLLPNLA